MKRKSVFLVGTIAILSVVFWGACPTGGGEDDDSSGFTWTPGTPLPENQSYPEVGPDEIAPGAKVYFLAASGNDETGDGSKANPWLSINKANSVVQAGDTVYLRAGRYMIDDDYPGIYEGHSNAPLSPKGERFTNSAYNCRSKILFSKSGEQGKPITYAGYPGDLPSRAILDFSQYHPSIPTAEEPGGWTPAGGTNREFRTASLLIGSGDAGVPIPGVATPTPGDAARRDRADWTWLRDFDITGTKDYTIQSGANGYAIFFGGGSHVTIEGLRIYKCEGTGVYVWQHQINAFNIVKNCDFFNLHSENNPAMDNNTDGAGWHLLSPDSVGNVFYGNRAWAVGDDAFDNIRAAARTMYDNNWVGFAGFSYRWQGGATSYNDWSTRFLSDSEKATWTSKSFTDQFDLMEFDSGNGNGLKMGGYGMADASNEDNAGSWQANPKNPGHVMRNNLAIGNHRAGVTHNYAGWNTSDTEGQYYFNLTAYNNWINFEMISRDPGSIAVSDGKRRNAAKVTMKNNISYKNTSGGGYLDNQIDYVKDAQREMDISLVYMEKKTRD